MVGTAGTSMNFWLGVGTGFPGKTIQGAFALFTGSPVGPIKLREDFRLDVPCTCHCQGASGVLLSFGWSPPGAKISDHLASSVGSLVATKEKPGRQVGFIRPTHTCELEHAKSSEGHIFAPGWF